MGEGLILIMCMFGILFGLLWLVGRNELKAYKCRYVLTKGFKIKKVV